MTRIADLLIVLLSWWFAYPLRFDVLRFVSYDQRPPESYYTGLLPMVLALWAAGFQFFGVLRLWFVGCHSWAHSSHRYCRFAIPLVYMTIHCFLWKRLRSSSTYIQLSTQIRRQNPIPSMLFLSTPFTQSAVARKLRGGGLTRLLFFMGSR